MLLVALRLARFTAMVGFVDFPVALLVNYWDLAINFFSLIRHLQSLISAQTSSDFLESSTLFSDLLTTVSLLPHSRLF